MHGDEEAQIDDGEIVLGRAVANRDKAACWRNREDAHVTRANCKVRI